MTRIDITERAPIALGGRAEYICHFSDLFEAILAYANSDISPELSLRGDGPVDELPLEEYELQHGEIEQERQFAQKVLKAAAQSRASLIQLIDKQIAQRQRTEVTAEPMLVRRGRNLELGLRFRGPKYADSWILFFAAWLVDQVKTNDLGIGRCKLDSCGRFFRVTKKERGRPRRDYCLEEHMKLAHSLGSTRRSRNARDRRKAEAAKPRRRRST